MCLKRSQYPRLKSRTDEDVVLVTVNSVLSESVSGEKKSSGPCHSRWIKL